MPKLSRIVALASVADVPRSIAFYQRLGFTVENTVEHDGVVAWAWLDNGAAALMITRAEEPLPPRHSVLFYLYGADVKAMHAELAAAGVAVSEIKTPFYAPQGEFEVTDPDGYVLMLTHDD